jgi:hypothetical protein
MKRSCFFPVILLLLLAGRAMTQCVPGERPGSIGVQGFHEVERVWTDSAAGVRLAFSGSGTADHVCFR